MDREQFDAITRLFAVRRSRRLAIAALAGTALFHHAPAEGLAKKNRRKRRRKQKRLGTGGICTPLENLCAGFFSNPCCPNTECVKPVPTQKVPLPGTCQSTSCPGDATCAARFPNQDVFCEKDTFKCAGLRGSCCLPKPCNANSECPHSGLCCAFLGSGHCCAPGQTCSVTGCFGGISK